MQQSDVSHWKVKDFRFGVQPQSDLNLGKGTEGLEESYQVFTRFQAKDSGGLDWQQCICILKVELRGFAGGFMKVERPEAKVAVEAFGLSLKDRMMSH